MLHTNPTLEARPAGAGSASVSRTKSPKKATAPKARNAAIALPLAAHVEIPAPPQPPLPIDPDAPAPTPQTVLAEVAAALDRGLAPKGARESAIKHMERMCDAWRTVRTASRRPEYASHSDNGPFDELADQCVDRRCDLEDLIFQVPALNRSHYDTRLEIAEHYVFADGTPTSMGEKTGAMLRTVLEEARSCWTSAGVLRPVTVPMSGFSGVDTDLIALGYEMEVKLSVQRIASVAYVEKSQLGGPENHEALAAQESAIAAMNDVLERVKAAPAHTLEGLRVKARAAAILAEDFGRGLDLEHPEQDRAMANELIRALLAMPLNRTAATATIASDSIQGVLASACRDTSAHIEAIDRASTIGAAPRAVMECAEATERLMRLLAVICDFPARTLPGALIQAEAADILIDRATSSESSSPEFEWENDCNLAAARRGVKSIADALRDHLISARAPVPSIDPAYGDPLFAYRGGRA